MKVIFSIIRFNQFKNELLIITVMENPVDIYKPYIIQM